MFLVLRSGLVISRRTLVCRCWRAFTTHPPELPKEPTTCCMSGCANCVWIEYAEKVKHILVDNDSEQIRKMVLDKIQDPNMKAFLSMELKSKGL